MTVRRGSAGIAIAAVCLALAGGPAGGADPHRVSFGHSVGGRQLVAVRSGELDARRKVLIVGEIHGNEPQGRRIVKRVRDRYAALKGAELWTVKTVNPDGHAHRRRTNSRGVDLNRNFAAGWRRAEPPGSGYYQGPKPFSEPESRAVRRLAKRIRPDLSIWYHQPWNEVLLPCKGKRQAERRYARITRMRAAKCKRLGGTAIRWEKREFGGTAFVVELHPGRLRGGEVRRHARAVAALAKGS